MRYCRTLFFLLLIGSFCLPSFAEVPPAESHPTTGRVESNVYRNSFFGFNYFVPEEWAGNASKAKLPGISSGFVLMQAKRKAGDPLSSITISVADLTPYEGKLELFLQDRYRLKREAIEYETTINGVRMNKMKGAAIEPEMLVMADRNFYRIATESTGVTRLAMVTSEKGYAIMFELIVPTRYATEYSTPFVDSLHALVFQNAAAKK